MKIITVTSKADWQLFHQVPHRVYRDDPNWICPLESDVEGAFDPEKNLAMQRGEAACYVLLDDAGQPAGRVAAFVDHERNETQEHPLGGMGFFECIENADYARALFRQAEDFLTERNVAVMEGPVNFGERERFWGLLVKGFDPPLFQENYQPPYYRPYFEEWGFQPFEQVLTLKGLVDEVPIERFRKISDRIKSKYPVHGELVDMKRLDKYAEDFRYVYNRAFRHFPHFKEISTEQMRELFNQFKPIADTRAITVVYHDNTPAGFCVLLPDIAPYVRFANGRLSMWKLPVFLFKFKTARRRSLKGIAFGIDPAHQRKGLYSIMVDTLYSEYIKTRYPVYYLAGIRAHNEVMVKSTLNLGVQIDRVHLTYRKNLLPDIPFEPFPFIDIDEPSS